MRRNEIMIVELEGLLRRRSKVALVIDLSDLAHYPELQAVCERVFGVDAATRFEKFLRPSKHTHRRRRNRLLI